MALPMPRPHRPLIYVAAGALFVIALPLALLVTDVAVTAVVKRFRARPAPPGPGLRIPSAIYHHDLSARFSGEETWGPVTVPYLTNSLGFRDSSVREVPLRARNRLLILGDSFAEGMGVPYGETFAGRLARAWDGKRDVLNAAVSSYSPIIYYRKSLHLLETVKLEVDAVLLFLDLSDIHDSIFYRFTGDRRVEQTIPFDNNVWARLTARDSLSWLLSENTTILGRAWEALYCRRHPDECRYSLWPERGNWTGDETLWREFGEEGLRLATGYMDELQALLLSRNISLTVVIYPWPAHIFRSDRENRHVFHWREWAKRKNVPLLDLFPVFTRADPRETLDRYFIPKDVHWNAEGHALIANEVQRALRSK
jgi:hypothetical protein